MDAFITRRGGAGGGLNFKVVGGTTQPTNPKENTIWVNTPDEITSWIFSAEEPESPEPGMIWFFTDTSGEIEFNALKENGIQVYPYYTKQYINGGFVHVPAKIYQNGEWSVVPLRVWSESELAELWTTANNGLTVKIEANGLRLTRNGTFGVCNSNVPIKMIGFNTLFAKYSELTSKDNAAVQCGVNNVKYTGSGSVLAYSNSPNYGTGVTSGTVAVPLSSVKDYEDLYIYLGITGATSGSALIERVWLE